MPNSGYSHYGFGGYPSFNIDSIIGKINLKKSAICSGNSFDNNATDYHLILQNNCAARDMEAAAVAWVSALSKTPMFAIKGITDIISQQNSKEQFDKNVVVVSEQLAKKLQEILNRL